MNSRALSLVTTDTPADPVKLYPKHKGQLPPLSSPSSSSQLTPTATPDAYRIHRRICRCVESAAVLYEDCSTAHSLP